MLKVSSLNAGYGKFRILFDVNCIANEKEITVVVGPNGSGKTTLLRGIFGLVTIYSGDVILDGQKLTRLAPHEIAKKGVAYLPQTDDVFSNLTLVENLVMAGYTLEKDDLKERFEEVLSIFPVLKGYLSRKAGTLSGGERRMLAMAMALLRRPKVMMFDEPTSNLAPKVAVQVFDNILKLRDSLGMTIILVEQVAKKALEIGDHALLMVGGKSIFEGKCEELLTHPELGKLYLGIKTGV